MARRRKEDHAIVGVVALASAIVAPSPANWLLALTGLGFLTAWFLRGHDVTTLSALLVPERAADRMARRFATVEEVRALDWKRFERLVTAHYMVRGCRKVGDNGYGRDGGVDIDLRCGKRRILVQCKRWKASKVGVGVIREMYGVMVAEGADEVHIVASGRFTKDAWFFAKDKPIRLIGGKRLVKMIAEAARSESPANGNVDAGRCPKCGALLVERSGRHGPFLGCSAYPRCRHTEPM